MKFIGSSFSKLLPSIVFGYILPEISCSTPPPKKNFFNWGRGGGQVVSVLAFYSDEPSSNPADTYSFFFVFEKRYINFKKVL